MCMIMYHPKGAPLPSTKLMANICSANPHGFGIHKVGGKVCKTTDVKMFFRWFVSLTENDEFLVHCRLATHGSKCSANCHPFYDEKTGAVFAHNGIIRIKVEGDKTDSQTYFEKVVLPSLMPLYNGDVNPNDSQLCGSRLALYVPKRGYRFYGNWYEHRGLLFSKMVAKKDTDWMFDSFGEFTELEEQDPWDIVI